MNTKKLLSALLESYIINNDLENVYNSDGSALTTIDKAIKFVDELKEEANPEQVAFESQMDTIIEEYKTVFPPSINETERGSNWFDLMHTIWNKHVQVELRKRYTNL